MISSRLVRRSMPAIALAVFLSGCGSSTNTPAVDTKLVQQRLDEFVAAVTQPQADAEFSAKAEGGAKVETESDGTVVGTLPRITFTAKEGTSAVLDPISIRFGNGGSGLINVEAKLPSSVVLKEKDGSKSGEFRIGSQTLKGVWVEKLQTIDNVDVRLSDVSVAATKEPGSAKIEEIALTGKLTPKGSGLYDGVYDVSLKGFAIDDPKEKSVTRLGTLSVKSAISGAKLEAWAAAAKEAGYTLANPNLYKAWTGGTMDTKMVAFLKRMPEFLGSLSYVYAVDGIDVTQDGKQVFGLKKSTLGFGIASDVQGMTKVRMTIGLGGFSTSADEPMLPPEADIQDASLEIEASGVPGQKLWDIYMDALPQLQAEAAKVAGETASGGESTTTAGSNALADLGTQMSGKFMEVMSAAKLSIAMNKLSLLTPTAKLSGRGTATYLPTESLMPEGKINLRFTGIDALAKAMEKRGSKDEMAQQIMGVIMGVRSMGRPDPASSANDRAYIIEIVFSKDGSVLANGQKLL